VAALCLRTCAILKKIAAFGSFHGNPGARSIAQGSDPATTPPLHQDVHMQVDSFFEWLGQAIGSVIRFIIDTLSGLFNLLSNAGSNFVEGLAQALGMETSIISIITLILGLMLLWSAIRAFMNASIIMGIIWLLLGLWLLSWIIH
jgi:phage shock protein PspC (stress-responsive transcriptional regulator)